MAKRKTRSRRTQVASRSLQSEEELAGEAAGQSGCQRRDLEAEVELVMRPSTPRSAAGGAATGHTKVTAVARMVFSRLWLLAGALVSLWRHLTRLHLFSMQKLALQKKRFWLVILLLLVALAAVACRTSLPCLKPLWNCLVLRTQEAQEEVAWLRVEMITMKQYYKELKEAVDEMIASEEYVKMSDWALQSSGASIDIRRTSETFIGKVGWFCKFIELFCTPRTPDLILQPDVSPGSCWPFPGQRGQVVIRLPARVHLTAITVQHISKEVSPSGTVTSAPRDIAVFGVDADGEEETLLVTFMYDIAKETSQTFPLKNSPYPRAFSYIKLVVKSNWGRPQYTCIYQVQVHGKMAKPEAPTDS